MQSAKLHKRTGTPLYMAPELFMRYYGVESDMVRTDLPPSFAKGESLLRMARLATK